MRFTHTLLAVYVVALPAAAVTYLGELPPASWLVALVRSGHPPSTWMELALVLALWQACLAPPACAVGAIALYLRGRPGVAAWGALGLRVRHALWGVGLSSIDAAWLVADLGVPSLHASMSWAADGITLAALVTIPLGIAFVIDSVLPFVVLEGTVTEHVQFGRPRSAFYLLRIAGQRVEVPRRVWDAVPSGARVRVTRWSFSDRFVALEER